MLQELHNEDKHTNSNLPPPQYFMPYVLPVAEIYLQPCLTLTFDLLTPLVDHVMALPVDHLCQLASNCFTIFETLCSKVW